MVYSLTNRARKLRKNTTDAEKKMWNTLRNRQLSHLKFRRQYPCGRYVLDFYCAAIKLCIELDGSQHYGQKGQEYDIKRSEFLKQQGIIVLRYSDKDALLTIESVLEDIMNYAKGINSSPSPSPQ